MSRILHLINLGHSLQEREGVRSTLLQVVTWSPGPLVTWSPGRLVTWSPGHLVTWLPHHGLLVTWSPGHPVTWSPGYGGHDENYMFHQFLKIILDHLGPF